MYVGDVIVWLHQGCYDVVDVDVAKQRKTTSNFFRRTDLNPDGICRIGPRKRS